MRAAIHTRPKLGDDCIVKRFHIALAVADLDDTISDYTARLGRAPVVVIPGKYALWRTDEVNLSINQTANSAGALRHVGFEDPQMEGFESSTDVNGIEWERFSARAQDAEIVEVYGKAPHSS